MFYAYGRKKSSGELEKQDDYDDVGIDYIQTRSCFVDYKKKKKPNVSKNKKRRH